MLTVCFCCAAVRGHAVSDGRGSQADSGAAGGRGEEINPHYCQTIILFSTV